MFRKLMFVVVLFALVANLFAGAMPAAAAGPADPIWAPDFRINTYNWPSTAVAGKQFEATLHAGSETAGVAAQEPIRFEVSEGGNVVAPGRLDSVGSSPFAVTFTKAGLATVTVSVGADEFFTYTVKAGDCLQNIAAVNGDLYPEIWERNLAVVGDNPARLSPGQVLNIVRFAPSRTMSLTVLPAEAADVVWTSPLKSIAGEMPSVSGRVQDRFGNTIAGSVALTVTLDVESWVVTAAPNFVVQATTAYTKTGAIALGAEPYEPIAGAGFEIKPAAPAKLSAEGMTELMAGEPPIALVTRVTDEFNNPIANTIVAMGQITETTGATGLAIFSYEVPTQTQKVALTFEAAVLTATHTMTVTPAAAETVTATVRADGAVLAHVFDQYGNPRIGDPVNVSVESAGRGVIVETKSVAPEPKPTAAPTAAPVADEYEVVAGDSLWTIWQQLGAPGDWENDEGTGWKQVTMTANGLSYTGGIVVLQIGQVLTLPDC